MCAIWGSNPGPLAHKTSALTNCANSTSSDDKINRRFNEVNSGNDPRVRVTAHMHALNPEEIDTYTSLLGTCKTASIIPSVNHCVSRGGDIEGFRFTCKQHELASCLPMHHGMFFNTAMVECILGDDRCRGDSTQCTDGVLKLQASQQECIAKLEKMAQVIHEKSLKKEVRFDCMPENTERVIPVKNISHAYSEPLLGSFMCRKISDCKEWFPEIPQYMGLFHSYTRSFNEDFRRHRLHIVVSGGCTLLANDYYNLVSGTGHLMSSVDLHDSVETWYARKTSLRSNCRILHDIAQEFDLKIPQCIDTHYYDPTPTCLPTTVTWHSDMSLHGSGEISLFNNCVNTNKSCNGVMLNMHPDEGVWLFKGPPRTSCVSQIYGGAFGNLASGNCFPSNMPHVSKLYSWHNRAPHADIIANRRMAIIKSRDGSAVSRINAHGVVQPCSSMPSSYTCVDESFFNSLQGDAHWKREFGVVEMMPIAVVHRDVDAI